MKNNLAVTSPAFENEGVIPVQYTGQGEDISPELNGAAQGRGYGRNKYRDPKPPFNWSHCYQFNVYALDCLLDLPGRSRKRDVLAAMEGHILQEGCLVGRFR